MADRMYDNKKPKPKAPLDPQYSQGEMPNRAPIQARIAPMQTNVDAAMQDKALRDLMAKRAKESKKTGLYPNYGTN
jgi:hypothetical protein